MAWRLPTSFTDSDNKWNNEAQSYDGNIGTGANSPNSVARTWGSYIELNITSISCDKIRFNALYNANINSISVDVYYSNAWHNIFEGVYTHQTWEEKTIGSTQNVTKTRIRFYAKKAATAYLYELEFNEILPTSEYYQNISGGLTFISSISKSIKLKLFGRLDLLGQWGKSRKHYISVGTGATIIGKKE